MSAYTKEEIIKERKLGLHYFDEAVLKLGIQFILDKTIETTSPFFNNRNRIMWDHVEYAFAFAWAEHCSKKTLNTMPGSFNLDEALTQSQIDYLATSLNIKEKYKGVARRKLPKAKDTSGKLSSKDIKKKIVKTLQSIIDNKEGEAFSLLERNNIDYLENTFNPKESLFKRISKSKYKDGILRVFDCCIYIYNFKIHVYSDESDMKISKMEFVPSPHSKETSSVCFYLNDD